MQRIEHEGAWATIRPSNMLVEDQNRRYQARCVPLAAILADEYGVSLDIVDQRLAQFSRLSSRIADSDGLAFTLIEPQDFASVILGKFKMYIEVMNNDETQFQFVDKILDYIYGLEAPADPDIAPGVTFKDPKDRPPESGNSETSSNTSSTPPVPDAGVTKIPSQT